MPSQPGKPPQFFEVPADTPRRECRSCGMSVWWVETPKGKRRMPVDCNVPGGNPPITPYEGVTGAEGRGVSHFATCADADRWRKRDGPEQEVGGIGR